MAAKVADWAQWCEQEKSWLAREFLRAVEVDDDIRPFFGSWFAIRGYKQTGYFLGCEVVRRLEAKMTLQEIALLEDVEVVFSGVLRTMAADGD